MAIAIFIAWLLIMIVVLFCHRLFENWTLFFVVVFRNRYKTGNNIDAQETGFIKDIGQDHPNGVLVQHGEYQYEAPNGEVVKVQYTADGNL